MTNRRGAVLTVSFEEMRRFYCDLNSSLFVRMSQTSTLSQSFMRGHKGKVFLFEKKNYWRPRIVLIEFLKNFVFFFFSTSFRLYPRLNVEFRQFSYFFILRRLHNRTILLFSTNVVIKKVFMIETNLSHFRLSSFRLAQQMYIASSIIKITLFTDVKNLFVDINRFRVLSDFTNVFERISRRAHNSDLVEIRRSIMTSILLFHFERKNFEHVEIVHAHIDNWYIIDIDNVDLYEKMIIIVIVKDFKRKKHLIRFRKIGSSFFVQLCIMFLNRCCRISNRMNNDLLLFFWSIERRIRDDNLRLFRRFFKRWFWNDHSRFFFWTEVL